MLSQNPKDLQTQIARIKQTFEKVLDKNTYLLERIRALILEQIVIIISTLTAFLTSIATVLLSAIGDFGERGGTQGPPSKDEGALNKWLNRLADALKRLVEKADEALPAIVGSVVDAVLSFLGKAVLFVTEHTWALIVFVAGCIDMFDAEGIKEVGWG